MAKVIPVSIKLTDGTLAPAQAVSQRQGLYKILPPLDKNAKVEAWEFPPGTVVRILEQDDNGKKYFLARDRNN